jgi:hypothetical protein
MVVHLVILVPFLLGMLHLITHHRILVPLVSELPFLVQELSSQFVTFILKNSHLVFFLMESQLDSIFFSSQGVDNLLVEGSRGFVLNRFLKPDFPGATFVPLVLGF